MKIYDKIWNYSIDDIPNINDKIMICKHNQNNDFPYLVEDIKYEKEIDVSGKWGASMLIPTIKSFYMYDGSLPFPPCDTNYKVIVYEDIGTIGRTNIERIKLNLGENIRNIQPINNRIVFYKIDYKNKKNKNTIVESKNKYLKCRQNQFIKNTPKETIGNVW